MGAANVLTLMAMTLMFVVWAVAMFITLARLWRRANARHAAQGGGYFAWAGQSLAAFGRFITSAEDRHARRQLALLTLLMIGAIALRAAVLSGLAQ